MSTETQPLTETAAAQQANTETGMVKLPAIIKITRIIAWVVLIGGILGAFEIYNSSTGSSSTEGLSNNTYAVGFSLGSLFTSVVIWAVLSLMAVNSENLYYIRCELYYKNNGE